MYNSNNDGNELEEVFQKIFTFSSDVNISFAVTFSRPVITSIIYSSGKMWNDAINVVLAVFIYVGALEDIFT